METDPRKLKPSICDLCGEAPAEFMRFRYWRSGGMDWPNVCRACDRDDPGGAWKLADWSWGQLVPHGVRAEMEEWARERRAGPQPVAGGRSGQNGSRNGQVRREGPGTSPADGRPAELELAGRPSGSASPRSGRRRVRGVGHAALVLGLGALAIGFADELRWLVLAPASTAVRLLGFLATLLLAGFVSGLLLLPFRRSLDRGAWTGGTGILTLAIWLGFLTWVMYG